MAFLEIEGAFSVKHYPTRLKGIAPADNYIYGQVGTRITREIVFATTIEVNALTLKYGFAKNSDNIYQPTNPLDPDTQYQISDDYFKNLITGAGQAYTGGIAGLNYMNPVSGKDGAASYELIEFTFPEWDRNIIYNKGDLVTRDDVNYISLQDDNERQRPDNKPEFWSPVFVYRLTQDFIIQPLAIIDDFDDAGNYIKPPILQNFESAKPTYQIDIKDSVSSPVVLASSAASDPLIEPGAIGFIGEKLNGLPLDIALTDLKINNFEFGFREDTNNTFEFIIESNQYTLSLADTLVQIIAYNLTPPEDLNLIYLNEVNYSNVIAGESQGYITTLLVEDVGGGKLRVSGNVEGLNSDVPVIIYTNIISNTSEESEQTLLLFYGNPSIKELDPAYKIKPIYGASREVQFFPEFSGIDNDFGYNNAAAFVDDIIVTRSQFSKINDLAQLQSIVISLVNGGSEVLQTITVNANQIPFSQDTNYQINSLDREVTTVVEFINSDLQIEFPFKILESWTNKEDIRLTYQIGYTLNGVVGVDIIESAPLRLGNYDQTKNTGLEPQVLATYTEKIQLLSEDGTVNINQFNINTNTRLKAQFQDINPITDDLQTDEADLTGFFGIALPNSPDALHYIHKEFGALGSTFYQTIDGSLVPELKITKVDNRTAEYEAIVDVNSMQSILGESDDYYVVCRCDRVEEATQSLDQYTFIFNANTSLKYNFSLDSDLLKNAFISLYYSVNYPVSLTFTHVLSATSFTNFESLKAYVNSNANSGDVITIETTNASVQNWGSIYEAIVKLNIPRTADVPAGSIGIFNALLSNYVEHENIYAFDNAVEISNLTISGASTNELYYAIREVGGELTEFKLYDEDQVNAEIATAIVPILLHVWGARSGGVNSMQINYTVQDDNKLLKASGVYGQNINTVRPSWDFNSFIFSASQWLVVGDNTTPYEQIEVRENFTFLFVFWQDAVTGSRQQLFTTNSRISATPNSALSFNTVNKTFNLSFVDYDEVANPEIIRSLNFSGIGVKAGYNFVLGHWDAFNENNRHIFINGLLQKGDIDIVNDFDINNSSVINTYDEALYGANDFDSAASDFFTGKLFKSVLSAELFQDRTKLYREYFLRGEVDFDSSKVLLSGDFNKTNGTSPDILKDGTTPYPVAPRNATTYIDFNTLV